jgi:hypothetical protein
VFGRPNNHADSSGGRLGELTSMHGFRRLACVSDAFPTPRSRGTRSGMERRWKLWLAGVIPPVLYLVGLTLPSVNGAHVWLGLPSLVWWMVLSAVSVTAVLAYFERAHELGGEEE